MSNINWEEESRRDGKMLVWTVLSSLIQSLSLVTFSMPAKLYPGGFSGVSRILSDLLLDFGGIYVPFGVFYAAFNLIITLLVFRHIGKHFMVFSFVQFSLVSVFTLFFQPLFPVEDPLLAAVFGGVLNGFAIGLALSHNASSGGTDFIAVYVSSRFNRPIWNYIMAVNVFILCLAGLLYGWERALYSIIFQFCSTQVVNRMHKRYRNETLTIITAVPEDVEKSVLACVRHGITRLDGEGVFSHTDRTLLYMIINSYQEHDVVNAILKADPHAFINVQETKRVIGNYYQKPLD